MSSVLRCKRDMAFWACFGWTSEYGIGELYCRICHKEDDLGVGRAVTRSSTGVRTHEFETWNWCQCYGGCVVGVDAVEVEREYGGRADAVEARQRRHAIRSVSTEETS